MGRGPTAARRDGRRRVSWLVMKLEQRPACPPSVAFRARAKAAGDILGRSTRSLQPPMAAPQIRVASTDVHVRPYLVVRDRRGVGNSRWPWPELLEHDGERNGGFPHRTAVSKSSPGHAEGRRPPMKLTQKKNLSGAAELRADDEAESPVPSACDLPPARDSCAAGRPGSRKRQELVARVSPSR